MVSGFNVARVYQALGKTSLAIKHCQSVLPEAIQQRNLKMNSFSHFRLGEVYFSLSQWSQVIFHFDKIVSQKFNDRFKQARDAIYAEALRNLEPS